MNTPQSTTNAIRADEATGYAAVASLGSAFPPNPYQGHLLSGSFHSLDPVFGGLKVDYHV